jgi:hypothetical protein
VTLLRLLRLKNEGEKASKWTTEDDHRLDEMLNIFMGQFPDRTGGWTEVKEELKQPDISSVSVPKADETSNGATSRLEKFQGFFSKRSHPQMNKLGK